MPSSHVAHTPDGHHIVVSGRRWRATDPGIPEPLRKELVTELMSARRAVRASADDTEALADARRRVNLAKIALGERGEPWWESRSAAGLEARARAAVHALLAKRGPDSSICPSDVARIVASPEWRPVMEDVRATVAKMASEGLLVITQGGDQVHDLEHAVGPIRLRLPRPESGDDGD